MIHLYRHPFAGCAPEVFTGLGLAQWLVDRYQDGPPVGKQIFAGQPSAETEITNDLPAIMRGDAPLYVVLESPGAITGNPFVDFIIAVVVNMAISELMAPDPAAIAATNRTQASPNNQLSNRENQVRLLERVEDIFGTVRSIPSLMMQPYTKYINHQKVEFGYYCIGRGYYDVPSAQVLDGDTAVSSIDGASAAVYAPFTSPNSGTAQLQIGDAIIDGVLTVERSAAVDGITMKPLNQIGLAAAQTYGFYGANMGDGVTVPTIAANIIYQSGDRNPNFAAVAETGQSIAVAMSNKSVNRAGNVSVAGSTYTASVAMFRGLVDGSTITWAGFVSPGNNGAKTVLSHTDTSVTIAAALTPEPSIGVTAAMSVNYAGTYTVASVENGYVTLVQSPFAEFDDGPIVADITIVNGLTEWTAWFTLPQTGRTQVFANVLAASGMYRDDGAKSRATVAYEVQYERLNVDLTPTGTVETATGSIAGATSDERAETLEHVTAWTGPVRVRMRRTTQFDYDFGGLVVDEIKWVDLYAVTPVDQDHFGNKTTIHTVTYATPRATTLRRRELNCLASRQLPAYNGTVFSGAFDSTGLLASGTIAATSKLVDILAAVTIDPKIGNSAISTIDMAQVWGVQVELDAWHAQAGQFNHTFDSDTLSFEETLQAIANAGFCAVYRQNGQIRLSLDRPQSTSVALFTHRNKRPRAERVTRTFANDSEYDGVELSYMDPETESRETIRLPLDGSFTKLKKVEIPGIRSYEQAWLRANREYNRLRYQRLALEFEATTDARMLLPNRRIDVVDNTRFRAYDGEVVAQSGLLLTLSRDVVASLATDHSIVLMKRNGTTESIACSVVVGVPNQVWIASAPAEAIVTTPGVDGIRTIFSFAADSKRGAMGYLVQKLGPVDGQYVRIEAINYSADYYAADSEAIPAKGTVIYD